MKLQKYISVLLLLITSSFYCTAQQTPMYSQYMFNDFIINPAVASVYDYYQIRTTNRFQWVGIKDAPITNILSVYGPNKKGPWGLGATVYSDNQGPTGKTGAYLSYGYYIHLTKSLKLSFGLSVGVTQFKIDETKIRFETEEPSLSNNKYNYINPDATTGFYLFNNDFFAGFSVDQLFQNKLSINYSGGAPRIDSINRLKSHFTIVTGYKYKINREYEIEPTLLFRATGQSSPQVEATARVIYNKTVWLGSTFRTSDAVSVLVGYVYKEKIYLGYSYDITYSRLKIAAQGTHEIMVGARFNKIRNSNSRRR